FRTLTASGVEPVLPVASAVRATIVRGPYGTFVLSHARVTAPALPILGVVATFRPLTVSVYVFDVLAVPFSHSTTHDVPLTVVPRSEEGRVGRVGSSPDRRRLWVGLDSVVGRDAVAAVLPALCVTLYRR